MESEEQKGLLTKLKPPRLEDAGLEDCALPPESIREAFFKAASSIRSSWAAHDEDQDQGCVEDPNPDKHSKLSDTLIGIAPTSDPGGPCGNEIGGGIPEVVGDEVAVGISGAQNEEDSGGGGDRLVGGGGFEVPSQEGERGCVDDGLGGGDGERGNEAAEEKECEVPILTEGFV